jgi:homoserine dehydrogenase
MDTPKKKVRLGLVGLGVVGQGVWKHVRRARRELAGRCGAELVLHRAAVRDLGRRREVRIPASRLTDDAMAVATDPAIDIVVEVMGGTRLARKVTLAALAAGKTVVTANKALLAEHGAEVFAAAEAGGGRVFFEAAVAGGIPIIKALREGLVANRFPVIYGILNGTCNYILTRMEREGKSFEEIVGDARRLGYVEADEALDLDGWDAAHKTAILAWLAHGRWIPMREMPVEGIRDVRLEDIELARKLGYRIKLLGTVRRDFQRNTVFASVHPMLVPERLALSRVDGVFNAISVTGDVVGETVYIGRGAGRDATASAVISDVVDAALYLVFGGPPTLSASFDPAMRQAPLEEVRQSYYLRLSVKDRPGVLAEIATHTAEHDLSIESVLQSPGGKSGTASLVLTTHLASERQVRELLHDLTRQKTVLQKPFVLRIADFEE